MTRPLLFGATLGSLLAALAMFACGGDQSGTRDAKLPTGTRNQALSHEACSDVSGRVENLDANGDGKPDIKRVYDKASGRELCRIADIDHDGKPEMFEYYDANGTIRRREADYDGSGVVDAIEYYQGGRLVSRELDLMGQHLIDTWDFFDPATGKRTRRERDTSADGKIDQWWSFEGEKITIAFDKNNDGQPDPDEQLTLGGAAASAAMGGGGGGGGGGGSPAADAGPPPSTASMLGSGDSGLGAYTSPLSTTSPDASILTLNVGADAGKGRDAGITTDAGAKKK